MTGLPQGVRKLDTKEWDEKLHKKEKKCLLLVKTAKQFPNTPLPVSSRSL
jgi:hypothetical protein